MLSDIKKSFRAYPFQRKDKSILTYLYCVVNNAIYKIYYLSFR